jgi:hypothetical protein
MRGFPIELLFILFFVAVVLLNALKQRAARRRPPEAAQEDEFDPDEIPEAVWRGTRPDAALWTDNAAPIAVPAPRRLPTPAAATPAVRRRRFDRHSLLGSQRQVQDAFVVATILGRCRADEPHEVR